MEGNSLIHPNLHGSRAGHSTATALSQLYDTWIEEVEQGSMVGVLLCDQSAAFDLCDHYLLVEKLKLMGVDNSAAAWFSSYLSGRKQSCRLMDIYLLHLVFLHVVCRREALGAPYSGLCIPVTNQM